MPDYVVSKVADALNDEGKSVRALKFLSLDSPTKQMSMTAENLLLLSLWKNSKTKGALIEYHDSYVPVVPPTREHAHFNGKNPLSLRMLLISFFCPLIILSTKILISVIIPAPL